MTERQGTALEKRHGGNAFGVRIPVPPPAPVAQWMGVARCYVGATPWRFCFAESPASWLRLSVSERLPRCDVVPETQIARSVVFRRGRGWQDRFRAMEARGSSGIIHPSVTCNLQGAQGSAPCARSSVD